MPGSWKEAKKILSSIGMEYQIVHACVNDCMLFHGNNAHLTKCSTCEEARYDPHMLTEKVPMKSVRWFPIIPHLLHMYRCTDLAKLMVWHKKHRSKPGVMRLPVDSPAHKHVESTWPEFECDPRHVRLGLASNGVSSTFTWRKGTTYLCLASCCHELQPSSVVVYEKRIFAVFSYYLRAK